jgi:hypothetical protein
MHEEPENQSDEAAPADGINEGNSDAQVETNSSGQVTLPLPRLIQESAGESPVQEAGESGRETDAHPTPQGSQVPVAPAPPPPTIPQAFNQLKAYCDEHHLKCTIETEFPLISLEFKNGRETRTVSIFSEEDAEALLRFPLDEIVFLGGYSAVCSYRGADRSSSPAAWCRRSYFCRTPHAVRGQRGTRAAAGGS